jgi:hypothetical protein
MIHTDLSTALRMPEPEIRHTTSAQPTRINRFPVRTRECLTDRPSVGREFFCGLNSEDLTIYKIDYTAVDEKPEMQLMYLKGLVGERI